MGITNNVQTKHYQKDSFHSEESYTTIYIRVDIMPTE